MKSIDQKVQQMAFEYMRDSIDTETILEIGKNLDIKFNDHRSLSYSNLIWKISSTLFNGQTLAV